MMHRGPKGAAQSVWAKAFAQLSQCELDERLRISAFAGASMISRALLAHGANPLATDEDGVTALLAAADSGAAMCIEALASVSDHGARDNAGRTALHRAAQSEECSVACLQLLLAYDEAAKHQDNEGNTALMIACVEQEWEIVELLLGHSDILASNHQGEAAVDIARKHQNAQIIDGLAEAAAVAVERAEMEKSSAPAKAPTHVIRL